MPQYVEVKGQVIEFPDGMSQGDIEATLKQNMMAIKPSASIQAGAELNSIPRQLGLTARYGLEGAANTAQIVTEPIRYVTDRMFGQVGKTKPLGMLATDAANFLGLPSPASANERVVGDASRLVAGTGLSMGLGSVAPKSGEISKKVADFFTQNPVSQITSAAGAGLAGGASKEAGGSTGQQIFASVLGGLAGGALPNLANSLRAKFAPAITPQELDVKISALLNRSGVDYSQVPERVRQSLRDEISSAMQAGKEVSPQALARLADFKAAGVTPTRGMLTLDPAQISREQNLAKIGANSASGELQGLARVQNENNAKLISNINALGAARGDAQRAGELLATSVSGTRAGLRSAEQAAWDAAKGSAGYRAPISSQAISNINRALGDEGLMPFMNPSISKYMEAFQTGQPFTPQAYRNLQSMLAREVAKGGNEGAAASLAQRVLLEADLRPAGIAGASNGLVTQGMASTMRGADTAASEAIDAVNAARRATRAAYAYEDSSPLVRTVLSGGATSDPQRLAKRFILGGTANEAADLIDQVGRQNIAPLKEAVLADLKSKALSGAADEVGKFSQSAFNKALNSVGERKLALLFSPEELQALRTNARVASYMQAQPVGSAVNNSNSGALLLGRGLDFLNNVPVIGPMTGPALKNIQVAIGNKRALDIAPALVNEQPKRLINGGLIAPIGGLLAAP